MILYGSASVDPCHALDAVSWAKPSWGTARGQLRGEAGCALSYDLAVWQGTAPSSDREGGETHERLYEEYLDSGSRVPAREAIAAFVAALTARWPDTGAGDDSPWAAAPLMRGASGPYIYIALAWASAEAVSAFVAETARDFGLVCFDPQADALRPATREPSP